MDFTLTDEQKMIEETTRVFVERELYPHEAEVERTGHLRMDLIREIQANSIAAGLYAANIPDDAGGVLARTAAQSHTASVAGGGRGRPVRLSASMRRGRGGY